MDTTTRPWHRAARALGVALAAVVALTPRLAHAVTIPVTRRPS